MSKTALITGIAGQDGRYLAEHLLGLGYRVVGMIHTQRSDRQEMLQKEIPSLEFERGDLTDGNSLLSAMGRVKPDEIYNLGALSFVGSSWDQAAKYAMVTGVGVLNALSAMRMTVPEARFYQASSSEMFGLVQETPQTEKTPFHPRSPYGVAKMAGHWYTVNFRESYHMFACSGILFNHESPRRGTEFVTRKITQAAARIKLGLQKDLELGNLGGSRDWGFAGDYVRAMYLMLQQEIPDDYVVASGETHTVREFVETTFMALDLPISWEIEPRRGPEDTRPEGLRTTAVTKDGRKVVRVSEKFFRPAEVDLLQGDSSKARTVLGWQPTVSFSELVSMMVKSDYDLEREKIKD